MIKEGAGHHPHSLRDAGPIADFISQHVQTVAGNPPPYLSGRTSRSSVYSRENAYRYFPAEKNYITCRGPWFSPSFDRYSFNVPRVEGTVNVTVPKTIAAGKPWVFRADHMNSEAVVDLALLAQGFHGRIGWSLAGSSTGRRSQAGMPFTTCSSSTGFRRNRSWKEPAARRGRPMPGPSRIPTRFHASTVKIRCSVAP